LVWIGFAEDDEQKSVRPVASAGFDQGYLADLHITWSDTERGQEPTGTAIRTRKPARCTNMLTDLQFAPWCEAARQRGYASSLVLPLISGDKAFGALNIYSKEPDGFPPEEEKLLVELAGDLAYGITTLRLTHDHSVQQEALQESERRSQHAQEMAHLGTWDLDLINNRLFWSDETYRIFGYEPQEFGATYEAFIEAVHPDDRLTVDQVYTSSIQDGRNSYEIEHRIINKATGEERIVQERCRHIRDATNRVIRSEGMVLDITELKRTERALRQARDDLELKVRERTQELSNANNQLRLEVEQRQKAQYNLETSLQELQVVEEELRNNNEMLIDAQKVLDDERQRYQDLFDFAPDGYLVTDCDGLIIEANQVADQMLEIPHQSLIGKPLLVFIAARDHAAFMHLMASLKRNKLAKSHELNLAPRKMPEFTAAVQVTAAVDRDGKDILRWTLRDITVRKRNEELIRQNAMRNEILSEVSQALSEASLDEKVITDIGVKGIARLVGDGCVIAEVSEDGQWMEPVAWHHQKPVALELMTALYRSTRESTTEGFAGKAYTTSQPVFIPSFSTAENGAAIPEAYRPYFEQVGIISMIIIPLKIGPRVIGTLGVTRDRHSRAYSSEDLSLVEVLAARTAQAIHNARLYQELQDALRSELEMREQLVQAEKFAAVGRLLASITHEINNPLQTIKNCLYLSQVDTTPGTAVADALSMAQSETNRLSNLVAQLREVYRPPTMGLYHPVDLPALLDETHTLLTGFLQEKHTTWVLEPTHPDLLGDAKVKGIPDQLKQVFLNIALNAIDAMEPDGGTITISLHRAEDGSDVGVRFKDTGPGLPDEVKTKLFEPFTTTKEKGLGLGLTICYDIIRKHEGHIDVESEPGQGTAFTVWLPAKGTQA